MSVPPSFGDVSKDASDLFKKGYTLGQVKLEASSQAKNGCEFKAVTTHEGSRVTGSLEAKKKVACYGVTATGKWNTENAFNLNVAVENQFVEGLKLTFDSTVAPHTGRKSGNVKAAYKRPYFNGAASVNFENSGTVVRCEDVFSYEKFVGGSSVAYNVTTGQLGSHNLIFGYASADFGVHAGLGNFARERGMDVTGSVFHRVSSKLHAGAQVRHTVGATDSTNLEVATKYACDSTSTLQARVNTRGALGLSYAIQVRPGVKMTLSSLVDTFNLNQPNHRLGLNIDFSGK